MRSKAAREPLESLEYFASTVRVGSLGIRLRTRDPELARTVEERYGEFTDRGEVDCEIELTRRPGEIKAYGLGTAYWIQATFENNQIRLSSPVLAGTIDLEEERGQLAIAPHPRFGAGAYLENALRQICQILAVRRGAFFLHAAAVARPGGDSAEVFPGKSGSGKTTISALLKETGGQVLSDDLVLLETNEPALRVISTPFFGTLRDVTAPPGRAFRISGLSFLEKSETAYTYSIGSPTLALALSLSNIPFADCFDRNHRQALLEAMFRLVEKIPMRRLGFRRDLSFLPIIGWETGVLA